MKKYILFAISFILLFSIFQILSGLVLTVTYTPDIGKAWEMGSSLSNETVLKGSNNPFILTLLFAFLSATIAYFIPSKVTKIKH